MNILVTVGMGPWPFDRLLRAIIPLCANHRVFVQTGTSKVAVPCPSAAFVSYKDLTDRIRDADVVITHAGNTVRLVQRAGKVPIAIARTAHGEMSNNHQVDYLRHEALSGRVIAVWDVATLQQTVVQHAEAEKELLATRGLPDHTTASDIITVLDRQWEQVCGNPFKRHPMRRYAYCWDELAGSDGTHLDVGCSTGEFLSVLAATTRLKCHGVDPHPGYLQQFTLRDPTVPVEFMQTSGPLPFSDGIFRSVSLLDVLEHCPSEDDLLQEIHRVLEPGGLLVLTVPAKHVFSFLDPDNVKFRWPTFHRIVYTLRFGGSVYRERFIDQENGLLGDMSIEKREHTNYVPSSLIAKIEMNGFSVIRRGGANLFWRWFHVPALLGGRRLRRLMERAIWLDGELFQSANLFLSLRRVP